MKKILLFALSFGVGSLAFAQTSISVDAFLEPTGNVLVGDSGPVNTIKISMTNNFTKDYLSTENNSASFVVTVDGTPIPDPTNAGWVRPLTFNFMQGATDELILTQSWIPSGPAGGEHDLCVTLLMMLEGGTSPQTNADPNSKFCKTFEYANPVGIEDNSLTEISGIIMDGSTMKVGIKNASQNVQINILNITGQTVKTVIPSVSGQNFYQNIDTSDLTSGVYIVTIQSENGVSAAQKVFVQ